MPLSQSKRPKIVAAAPCYNTERSIKDVVSKASKHADQVVVINDGSSDDTARVARTAGALVIDHGANRGYGESIKSCFEVGRANGADVLVTIDGDGQHSADEIPFLVAPILRGEADIVIGSRFLGKRDGIPKCRKFGIRVITFLFNLGSRVKVSDAQSGFRAHSRKALYGLSLTEKGMSISIESLIKSRQAGFTIREMPIACTYGPDSHSLNSVVHGLGVALELIRLRLRRR